MSEFAIQFENVSKKYKLGQISHGLIYKDLQSFWARLRGKEDPNSSVLDNRKSKSNGDFLALSEINFIIKPGEVIGIIGRNGAGKSTLLKILSRITSPTTGKIQFLGRMGSLLEVGTGFHPELTGRENIFLNGAILGMTRGEIKSKFDEIVDFSGIEKFIDTPVKRYSSGMYVRLAFAVAAHLEPEILVVDEVLAVGDMEFQKKCLGKMESVSKKSGRTILFVSHNMAAISKLCSRVIFLKEGKIHFDGETEEGIQRYIAENRILEDSSLVDRKDRTGEGKIQFVDAWTENAKGEKSNMFLSGDRIVIKAKIQKKDSIRVKNLQAAFALKDYQDFQWTDLNSASVGKNLPLFDSSNLVIQCTIPRNPFTAGTYSYNAILRADGVIQDFLLNIGRFQVEEGDFFQTGRTVEKGQGAILIDQDWDICAE